MWGSSRKKKSKYDHKDLYGTTQPKEVDITDGNPLMDARVIQYKREIKQLKEKVELQTELIRQLEHDKNELSDKLESYKRRCSDLQKNLDDKDQHLNDVVTSLTAQHSKPVAVNTRQSKSKWSFFSGSPRSRPTPTGLSSTPGPNMNAFATPQPLSSRSALHQNGGSISSQNVLSGSSSGGGGGGTIVTDSPSTANVNIHEDYVGGSPLQSSSFTDRDNIAPTLPCMTAPIGSMPTAARVRRHGSMHVLSSPSDELQQSMPGMPVPAGETDDGSGSAQQNWGIMHSGTSSLVGMERSEMEFKIKNSSSHKLRNYVRDLFDQYYALHNEKSQMFKELVKAKHDAGWVGKQANIADKEAKTAKEKEYAAKNHIRSLQKSLDKERKKMDKYQVAFEEYKKTAIAKRKELLVNEKKLKDIISMKDEFIQRACYKLILYKDRLSQFEIPVFQEYVILISPDIQILLRFDGEAENAPGANTNNLNSLHNAMVHKQTPGGDGPGFDDINEAGGTVTSIASNTSQSYKKGSIGHRKSSSSQPIHDGDAPQPPVHDGDVEHVHDGVENNGNNNNNKKKKKKRKKHKKKRGKSHEEEEQSQTQRQQQDEDQINIPIAAVSKKKKKGKKKKMRSLTMSPEKTAVPASLSNLSKKLEREKIKKKKKKEEKVHNKEREKDEEKKENEDYLDMDLDEMVSSDSSSSSSDEYLLLSDSDQRNNDLMNENGTIYEYRLDANGKYIECDNMNDGITNNLANYVELKLVKYPGTGELYLVITKFDEKKDAMEVFRIDFAKCINIDKSEVEQDFTIYFEAITLMFRADDYEKARQILITLRTFFEQHCTNIQPELPPPPESIVTDQMTLFFGD